MVEAPSKGYGYESVDLPKGDQERMIILKAYNGKEVLVQDAIYSPPQKTFLRAGILKIPGSPGYDYSLTQMETKGETKTSVERAGFLNLRVKNLEQLFVKRGCSL